MDWYCLSLSQVQVAAGEVQCYRDGFFDAFAAAQAPRSMALFQQRREDGGMDLFFTPESMTYAETLLVEWGCTSCGRPSMAGLVLLVGHNEMTYYMP